MKWELPIYYQEDVVGTAEIEKCGMFYAIFCRVNLNLNQSCRVKVLGENIEVDLGLCVPDNDGVYLKKRIPIKEVGGQDLKFFVIENDQWGKWYPIGAEMPFEQLESLSMATYCVKNGTPGLLIKLKA